MHTGVRLVVFMMIFTAVGATCLPIALASLSLVESTPLVTQPLHTEKSNEKNLLKCVFLTENSQNYLPAGQYGFDPNPAQISLFLLQTFLEATPRGVTRYHNLDSPSP
ncbi:hypothetical protein [Desulfurispira natronophila]|uniref:Uncharacterized protein n=1 Tax=Desulfurispira natronophila TaxID=682562 RepID=A0A7W7Y4T0_9BACT|nr:hypothetical protein [Desulfurispira natronophila]MBB5022012.1 hypothetical protein [Desulfurispira natronophila]